VSDVALPLAPVHRRKLHDEVAAQLEALILSARLGEGDALPSERALMEHFGVGRPAVRQALLTLERAGLVRVANGERARVARPTANGLIETLSAPVRLLLGEPQNVRHLQQARLFFEGGIARHAAAAADSAQRARIEAAWQVNRAALPDPASFSRTDVAFHGEIAAVAVNPIIAALGEAMLGWLTEQRTTTSVSRASRERTVQEHRAILDAILAGDGDAADAAMRAHLTSVTDTYWAEVARRRRRTARQAAAATQGATAPRDRAQDKARDRAQDKARDRAQDRE
jgi:GntR family transcriptional repressor for pyruvate dehydrogenase complex